MLGKIFLDGRNNPTAGLILRVRGLDRLKEHCVVWTKSARVTQLFRVMPSSTATIHRDADDVPMSIF